MTDERRGMPIKRRKDGGEFDLSSWTLNVQDSEVLRTFIGDAVTEAIELAADEKLLAEFGLGRGPTDPPEDITTIHIMLPFGAREFEGPSWTFTLTELVEWEIDLHQGSQGFDTDAVPDLTALRDALDALADRIDSVLPKTGDTAAKRRRQP